MNAPTMKRRPRWLRRLRRLAVWSFALAFFGSLAAGAWLVVAAGSPASAREAFLGHMQKLFPSLECDARSVRMQPLGGVNVRELRMGDGPTPLLHGANVSIVADHDALLQAKMRAERLVAANATIDLRRDPRGQWNFTRLAGTTAQPLEFDLEIRDGTVRVWLDDAAPALALTNVNGSVEPASPGGGVRVKLTGGGVARRWSLAALVRGPDDWQVESLAAEDCDLAVARRLLPAAWRLALPVAGRARVLQAAATFAGDAKLGRTAAGKLVAEGLPWADRLVAAGRWRADAGRAEFDELTVQGLRGDAPGLALLLPAGVPAARLRAMRANGGFRGQLSWKERLAVQGRATLDGSGLPFRQLVWQGSAEPLLRKAAAETLTVEGLDLAALPEWLPASAKTEFGPATASGSARIEAAGTLDAAAAPAKWTGAATIAIADATFRRPDWPLGLEQLAATLALEPGAARVERFAGKLGPAEVAGSARLPGWDRQRFAAAIKATGVPLGRADRARLPAAARELCAELGFDGSLDLDGAIAVAPGTPAFVGTVHPHGSVQPLEFPYLVTKVGGHLECRKDGSIAVACHGDAGGRRIDVTGQLDGTRPTSGLLLDVVGPEVAVDDALRAAAAGMPGDPASFIRKLRGRGRAAFVARIARLEGERRPQLTVAANLALTDVSAEFFPYRLDRFAGRVDIGPDLIELKQCLGDTDAHARVVLNGTVNKDRRGVWRGRFDVEAADVPLDGALRAALPPGHQKLWEEIRPEGRLAFTGRVVAAADATPRVALTLNAAQAAATPRGFPYRLEGLTGPISAEDGVVRWSSLTARHGGTLLHCKAGAAWETDVGGALRFEELSAPSVPIDAELLAAAPEELRAALAFLAPDKPLEQVRLRDLRIDWRNDGGPAAFALEDVGFEFRDAALMPSLGARATGRVALRAHGRGRAEVDGNLDLARLAVAGTEATGIAAKLAFRDQLLTISNAHGAFHGGRIDAPLFRVQMGPRPRHEIKLLVTEADLETLARARWGVETVPRGKANLSLTLVGPTAKHWTAGNGTLDILQLDLKRQPLLLDQLKFLLSDLPAGQVFHTAHADFRVYGMGLEIDKLTLESPALTFGLRDPPGLIDLETGALRLHITPRLPLARRGGGVPLEANSFRVEGTLAKPEIVPEPGRGMRRLIGTTPTPSRTR